LNSLEEKITAHYGTIYLISFTYVARLCASNLAKRIKKITSSFGVDYFLPLPLFKENLVKYKGKRISQDVVFIVFSSLIRGKSRPFK